MLSRRYTNYPSLSQPNNATQMSLFIFLKLIREHCTSQMRSSVRLGIACRFFVPHAPAYCSVKKDSEYFVESNFLTVYTLRITMVSSEERAKHSYQTSPRIAVAIAVATEHTPE